MQDNDDQCTSAFYTTIFILKGLCERNFCMYRHENDEIASEDVVNEYEVSDTPDDNCVKERPEESVMIVNKASDTSIISDLSEMSESNKEAINHKS